jgi:N-acetylglucosamine-6-phosphate deacetylase
MQAIKAKKIFTGNSIIENSYLIVNEELVVDIISYLPDHNTFEIHDYSPFNLAPAFIDLQIYGGAGSLFNTEPTPNTIQKTYDEISKSGTKHFQITLSTISLENMLEGIEACKTYKKSGGKGLIGVHLEGPYFNPKKRGAHIEKHVRKPTLKEISLLLNECQGIAAYITIAPEMFDNQCLNVLLDSDMTISIGHSDATFTEAKAAFGKGIKRVTHLFNAMSQFQSRAPGLVGATYDSDAWASIVADGIHVDFNSLKISKKIMGERLFYITDAVTQDTRGEYRFTLNGDHYVNEMGVLSGSALSMMQAVKNGVKKADIPLDESLRMASTIPAKVANLGHQLGKLEKGYLADYVVFDDDFNVIALS